VTRWHNHYLDGHPHFCTATVSGWRPLLSGNAIATLYREWAAVRRALGVKVLAYVVMPEHFHVVLWSESDERVCRFLQRTLGLTSRTFQPGRGFCPCARRRCSIQRWTTYTRIRSAGIS